MKTIYPKNIKQALILLLLPVFIVAPVFALKQFLGLTENALIPLFFGLWFVAILLFYRYKNKGFSFNFNLRVTKTIFVFILLIVCFQFLFNIPFSFFIKEGNIQTAINSNTFIGFLVSSLLIAPVVEEIIFRGIILDGFISNYNKHKAILYTTAIFMMVHLNYAQFTGALFIGLLNGYIYYYSKSILMPIILHFANNFLGILGLYLHSKFGETNFLHFYGKYSLVIYSFSFIFFLLIIYYLYRNKVYLFKLLK